MKYLFLVYFGLMIFACKQTSNDESAGKSTQQVKVILESVHDPIAGEDQFAYSPAVTEESKVYSSRFSPKGVLLEKSRFSALGNLELRTVYKYDAQNNNFEIDTYHSSGTLSKKVINKFGVANELVESNEFGENGKIITRQTSRFDSLGNRIFKTEESMNGTFLITLEQVFDRNERNIENYYFERGALKRREVNSYDDRGNLLEEIQYSPTIYEQSVTRHKYDKKNNRIETIVMKSSMVTSKSILKYDANNNLINVFTYGLQGNLKDHEKHIYQYDPHGNWTKQIILVNNRLSDDKQPG